MGAQSLGGSEAIDMVIVRSWGFHRAKIKTHSPLLVPAAKRFFAVYKGPCETGR